MAETANRCIGTKPAADGTSPSTADMKAAIRESRVRLATRLAQTSDHVHVLFRAPSSAQTEARDGGFIGGAIKSIAVVGRTTHAWNHARRTGLLRRAAIGAATVAIAAALARKTGHR